MTRVEAAVGSPTRRSEKWLAGMDATARWGAVGLMLGVPTSIALVNIGIFFMLVGWALSGRWDRKFAIVRSHPITLPCVGLFALVLVGTLYTEAPDTVVWKHLYVYSKFPMMLVLLTVFDDALWRSRAMAAFVIGSVITLLSTYANIWVQVPWSDSQGQGLGVSHHVFNDYIAQGLAMAVFVAWCFVRCSTESGLRARVLLALLAGLTIFSITHLLAGRTGQLVLLSMAAVMALVSAPARWRIPAVLAVFVVGVSILLSSSLLQDRVLQAWADFQHYNDGGVTTTSIGARLDMWSNAWNMFIESPLWGQGTGGYQAISSQIYRDPSHCRLSCIHPHNQYLFFAVEHGLPGLILYAWLLVAVARHAMRSVAGERAMLAGFLTILFVDGFINGPFWVTTERHLFASMLPLLMATWAARWSDR